MDECVPELMDYGKDQLTAVAACLNMWRDAWEESHPDGADDPGPSRPGSDKYDPDEKQLVFARAREMVSKLFNEADHPRDEHGRWADGGGSSSDVAEIGKPILEDGPLPSQSIIGNIYEFSTSIDGDGRVEVLVNPTAKDARNQLRDAGQNEHRSLRDVHGNVYMWPSGDAIHAQVATMLNNIADEKIKFDETSADSFSLNEHNGLSKYALSLIKQGQENAKRYAEKNKKAFVFGAVLRFDCRLFNEADHPRDEHGRWTDGGGSDDAPAPSQAGDGNAAVRAAIGKDLDHRNISSLKEAIDRGGWVLTVDKVKTYGGQKTTEIGISPPVPDDWKSHTMPTGSVRHYDPNKAHIDADGYVVPKVDTEAALPKTATPGVIYRGMSWEEYQASLKSGNLASMGGYNLEGQEGLTYFSSDPEQAVSYANSFAPWQYKAMPGRPAVVVGVADPGGHIVNQHQPTELGINKPVSTSQIREVYFGNPIMAQPGFMEVIQESGRPPMEGSRSSPSITVEWQKQNAPAAETLAGLPPDEELLFVSEFPNQTKLDKWNDGLNARSEELATQGLAGNDEDDHIARMSSALAKFQQEDDILLQSGDAGLNAVYDSNMKLQAAAFAYVKNRVAIISSFGALKHDAGVKALKQAALKYSSKTDQIEGKFWSDDTRSRAAYEEAGFKQLGETEGGMITMVKTDLPGGGVTKLQVKIRLAAEAMAKKLDFDPKKIVYTDEDKEFTLGGVKYKYAGSYQRGEPDIKLYNRQITPENVKGITAHEIGHRKFEMLMNQRKVQNEMMMQDPGPPPDPNHQYWWGKKGGLDAVMTPTGELRPPYDEKYPIVHEWNTIQNTRPSLEQDDGITDYSKSYWKEWEKGNIKTDTAYHETMAEISRAMGSMGKHSAATGSGWRRLYRLQEKVWANTEDWQRDMSMNAPVKSIFILNDIRWDIR